MNLSSLKLKTQFKFMIIFSMLLVIFVGFLIEYVSNYFVLLLFIYAIIVGQYFASKKCSKCGQRIIYRYPSILGQKIPFCVPWISEKCSKCGALIE